MLNFYVWGDRGCAIQGELMCPKFALLAKEKDFAAAVRAAAPALSLLSQCMLEPLSLDPQSLSAELLWLHRGLKFCSVSFVAQARPVLVPGAFQLRTCEFCTPTES